MQLGIAAGFVAAAQLLTHGVEGTLFLTAAERLLFALAHITHTTRLGVALDRAPVLRTTLIEHRPFPRSQSAAHDRRRRDVDTCRGMCIARLLAEHGFTVRTRAAVHGCGRHRIEKSGQHGGQRDHKSATHVPSLEANTSSWTITQMSRRLESKAHPRGADETQMNAVPPPGARRTSTQDENRALRGLLQSLGSDAAHNQQVLRRFQERELALLSAGDLPRLLECLTSGMRASFRLDSVKLKLLDPFFVIRDLLVAQSETDRCLMRDIELCADVGAVRAHFDDLYAPWLGEWDPARHLPLFGRHLNGSVALLPLRQADGLAGFLCLGSREPGRFRHDQATDFLAHMARVAAVCLENAVNRERLRLVGLTDALTGLYNRRHLEHRLEQEVTRAQRYAQSLACLFVDADHFKRINDRYGHAAGDQVLVALAQRLRTRLRASDLPTRYGGEEFAVLLPHTGLDSAKSLANEICAGVAAEPVPLHSGESVSVSVSIGVAALHLDNQRDTQASGRALLAAADRAVYEAKRAGRNCVACDAQAGV